MKISILAVIEAPLSDSSDPSETRGLGIILNELGRRRIKTRKTTLRFEIETLLVSSENKSERLHDRLLHRPPRQLWLFGCGNEDEKPAPLDPKLVARIFALMKRGMGIFATGDHGVLGADLAGIIPRVRRMRHWRPDNFGVANKPPNTGDHRIESLCPPLFPHKHVKPDYDDTPKRVYFARKWQIFGAQWGSGPHPLGVHPELKVIGYLPDHAHEGECRVPTMAEMDGTLRSKQDFPKGCRYQVAAYAARTGFTFDKRTHAEIYPVVSTFTAPRQGRVVVDSTFHHWVNGNIHATKMNRHSLAWQHIREYSANVATWLTRRIRAIDPARQTAHTLAQYRDVELARQRYQNDRNLEKLGATLKSVQTATSIDLAPDVENPAVLAMKFLDLLK